MELPAQHAVWALLLGRCGRQNPRPEPWACCRVPVPPPLSSDSLAWGHMRQSSLPEPWTPGQSRGHPAGAPVNPASPFLPTGSPGSPRDILVTKSASELTLQWTEGKAGYTPTMGYIIEARPSGKEGQGPWAALALGTSSRR